MDGEGSSQTAGQATQSCKSQKNDAYSKVQAPEKGGRVRCLRKISTMKKSSTFSHLSTTIEDQLNTMKNLLINVLSMIQQRFPGDQVNDIIATMNREVNFI